MSVPPKPQPPATSLEQEIAEYRRQHPEQFAPGLSTAGLSRQDLMYLQSGAKVAARYRQQHPEQFDESGAPLNRDKASASSSTRRKP